jgi:hypothetical protein
MGCKCPGLSARELARASALRSNRRDDQAFPVRRHVELGVSGDAQELEYRLVDDDARAVSDGLKTFDHEGVITPFTTSCQIAAARQSRHGPTDPSRGTPRDPFGVGSRPPNVPGLSCAGRAPRDPRLPQALVGQRAREPRSPRASFRGPSRSSRSGRIEDLRHPSSSRRTRAPASTACWAATVHTYPGSRFSTRPLNLRSVNHFAVGSPTTNKGDCS